MQHVFPGLDLCVLHATHCATYDNRRLRSRFATVDRDLSDVTTSGVEEWRIPPTGRTYVHGQCTVRKLAGAESCRI